VVNANAPIASNPIAVPLGFLKIVLRNNT